MCSDWSVLLGLADYSRGKEAEKEGREKWRNMERARQREREAGKEGEYSSESNEARQIQWRNPPSSQMNIAASLPPPPVSIAVFFPSSLPRFFSIIHQCAESPQLTAPAAAAALADPSSPLDLPRLPRLATAAAFPDIHPSDYPSVPEHGDSKLALFCC